jgi:hypothetical protein
MMTEIWQDAAFAIFGIIGLLSLAISGSILSGKKMIAIKKEAAEFPLDKLIAKVRDNYFWTSFMVRGFAALGIVFLMVFKTDFVNSIIILSISILAGYLIGKISKSPVLIQQMEIKEETILQ